MVLFNRSEVWFITGAMVKMLEVFNHLTLSIIVGMVARRVRGEGWKWPLVEEALEAAVLWSMQ